MILSIGNTNKLIKYVDNQLQHIFCTENSIGPWIEPALKISEYCYSHTKNPYYYTNHNVNKGDIIFSHLHSVQNSIFLYYLSRTIYLENGPLELCDSVYYLNRLLNGIDWYYQVNLPKIFGAEHPLGSILGKAEYSDKLFIYQGVTIGGNNMQYPKIGENVTMYSNSKILGNAVIGNNVAISANTYIKGEKIPNNCLVFGTSPNLVIIKKNEGEMNNYLTAFTH